MPETSPFRLLYAAGFAILIFIGFHFLLAPTLSPPTQAAAYVAAVGVSIAFFIASIQRPGLYRFNFWKPTRVYLTGQLISYAKQRILIYSGELHHGVYDNDFVLNALKDLPSDVVIAVYCDKIIDPKSKRIKEYLDARPNTQVFQEITLKPKKSGKQRKLAHFICIDKSHIRIEFLSHRSSSNGGPKFAVYLLDAYKLAHDADRALRNNVQVKA